MDEPRATLGKLEALRLIAWRAGRPTGCENYVGGYTCRDESCSRTKDASCTADRWCQACTATAALEGRAWRERVRRVRKRLERHKAGQAPYRVGENG